jgi:hypothetical protein
MTEGSPATPWTLAEEIADLPPRSRLLFLTSMKAVAQSVWALTALEIADHLAGGTRSVEELAEVTGSQPDSLYRVLRTAAAFGAFTELPGRRFANNAASETLRKDSPAAVRDLILMNGDETRWRPYGEILYSMRTGKPSFDSLYGAPYFDYIAEHPQAAQAFHAAMARNNARVGDIVQRCGLDLSRFSRVADLGGGEGYFLAELLNRHPQLSGVLFDRPAALTGAENALTERGVRDRVTLVPGDFFESVPSDCDAYVLKLVLHDWSDEEAARILRVVRAAVGNRAEARVFIVEHAMREPNKLDMMKILDLDMLLINGGRERDAYERQQLVSTCGWKVVSERVTTAWTLAELEPVGSGSAEAGASGH